MYGDNVVSGSRDGTLRVWDVVGGTCLHVLIGHAAAVRWYTKILVSLAVFLLKNPQKHFFTRLRNDFL